MNKTKWMLASLLTLAILLALPFQASAGWMDRVARKIGLSPAQQSQIKTIIYNARRNQITTKAKLQLARLDLRQLLDQHKPSETKVLAAVDKVGAIELQMKKSRILMMLRVKAVLTPQQAAKWQELKRRRRAWRRRRFRHRRFRQMRRRNRRRWRRRQNWKKRHQNWKKPQNGSTQPAGQ